MSSIDLSIIIPVYNVEKYIKCCIESLYMQNLPEEKFEIILVDDGSVDDSISIISSLMKFYSNITLITQENKGPSAARNKGIEYARGTYICFVDSDDVLLPEKLNLLLAVALEYKPDIVKGDLIKLSDAEIEKMDFALFHTRAAIDKAEVKSGEEGFCSDFDPLASYVVLNLIKKKFLIRHNLRFLEGKYFEDVAFTINTYLVAEKFIYVPIVFYIYRQRENSIMSTMNPTKLFSMNDVMENAFSLQKSLRLSSHVKKKLKDCLFAEFSCTLWYLSHYKNLYACRREIIRDLKKKIPGLFFYNSFKQIVISLFYTYIPFLYIEIRYRTNRVKY